MGITFAIARNTDVGVVIVQYSGNLSCIWRWDIKTDAFTPGQFLRGRAHVCDISPDGRYVIYFATDYKRPEAAFLAISHNPYFTALAYFPTTPNMCGAWFGEDGSAVVNSGPWIATWRGQTEPTPDRIEPDCPFPILRDVAWDGERPGVDEEGYESIADPARQRTIQAIRRWHPEEDWNALYVVDDATNLRTRLQSFPREPFKGIEPPEWARHW